MDVETMEPDVEVNGTKVDEPDVEVKDDAALGKEKPVYTAEQFNGLLRDRQEDRAARMSLQHQLAEAQAKLDELSKVKPDEKPLNPEEAEMLITRKDLIDVVKSIKSELGETLQRERQTEKQKTLSDAQANDARSLIRTKTDKVMGKGLDAKTVYQETVNWMQANDPETLNYAQTRRDMASFIDRYGRASVPNIIERIETRRNMVLAKKLDQSGALPPGGPGGNVPMNEEEQTLQQMLMGEISVEEIDKIMGIGS